jgi:hypothetical protein
MIESSEGRLDEHQAVIKAPNELGYYKNKNLT